MKIHRWRLGNLVALISVGCCLHTQAATQAMTFEQAVEKGTALKGCPKRDVGLIESAYLSDSEGNPKGLRPGKSTYLVVRSAGATSMPVIGPLATPPTDHQLVDLRGRRTCVITE